MEACTDEAISFDTGRVGTGISNNGADRSNRIIEPDRFSQPAAAGADRNLQASSSQS
jgi:hypothetical protein